ncbi:hypothetical protein GCM10027047_02360 [Rhodococcus aerolatus]
MSTRGQDRPGRGEREAVRGAGATRSAAVVPSIKPSAWNLLLLVPLLMLVTSFFNSDGPRLFGLPFFYWYQFLWVPVGVVSVGIVYVMTRDR